MSQRGREAAVNEAGQLRYVMAGVPAMTMSEIRAVHWPRGSCWCGEGHGGEATAQDTATGEEKDR